MEKFRISATFPVDAKTLYKAWMSSRKHSAIIGSEAVIENKKGGRFSTFDGYAWGITTELVPYQKIVQTWRTSEFRPGHPDSVIELNFKEKNGTTTLSLYHQGLDTGDGDKYRQGWKDYYFAPMKTLFKA